MNDDRFYRPAGAPISPLDRSQAILLEHTDSLQQMVTEDNRECAECYEPVDASTQERNDGLCNRCADKREFEYWEAHSP